MKKYIDFLNEAKSYLDSLSNEILIVGKQLKESKQNIEITSPDILNIINIYNGEDGMNRLREFYGHINYLSSIISKAQGASNNIFH